MAGLSDMEELVASVPEKEVAEYLREALACYGAGAHRACVVLSNIALFDGLRAKLKALSPVNKTAKNIINEIDPLADGQKVFETPLIHKMKSENLITELESQLLESINNHRNKAAHPSGHRVTAEEARFVFAEVITKFLSQPIRQTSYVVDQIQSRLADSNFFPSNLMNDMVGIVKQEISNLDRFAKPFLFAKLLSASTDGNVQLADNAKSFIFALANIDDDEFRNLIQSKLIDPKSSDSAYSEFISTLVGSDPKLFPLLSPAARVRTKALLISCAKTVGVNGLYRELRHPAHILVRTLNVLGEVYVNSELDDYAKAVLDMACYNPEFIGSLSHYPDKLAYLIQVYGGKAGNVDFGTANSFANALPTLEPALSVIADHEALYLLCCVVRAALWGAWASITLADGAFIKVPSLRTKAVSYIASDAAGAALIIASKNIDASVPDFGQKYLGML